MKGYILAVYLFLLLPFGLLALVGRILDEDVALPPFGLPKLAPLPPRLAPAALEGLFCSVPQRAGVAEVFLPWGLLGFLGADLPG